MHFEEFVAPARVRYFSLGRFALAAGLRLLGMAPGTPVLLPGFICRDVLASVHAAGGVPVFYPVDSGLAPALPPQAWPAAAAVVAINYFGFPQDLDPFREYCLRTGARLIEDNAHGMFSRDHDGSVLGLRGDMCIFSLRKTIPMCDGAALVVQDPTLARALEPQLEFSQGGANAAFRIKRGLRRMPGVGATAVHMAVAGVRFWRRVLTGYAIPVSGDEVETAIPGDPAPHQGLLEELERFDAEWECQRRRGLFAEATEHLRTTGVTPVFAEMGPGVVPYGYPFFADEESAARARSELRPLELECFRWPELPGAVAVDAPAHYRRVWLVNFL